MLIDIKDYVKEVSHVTKRSVLSVIASFYDPVGYIQPVIVQLKQDYKWDDKLNANMERKWEDIIENIKKIDEIQI